jgi:nucleotide-binding universal stress UspA family protein
MAPIRTILHPTDFSDHSQLAFELAVSLARQHGARLVICHVAVPPVVMYDEKGSLLPRAMDYRQAAQEQLGSIQPADPTVRVEHLLSDGEVPPRILRAAADVEADLIVMGSLGRTGLDRLLIGSIAADVMRGATCPVVTIRASGPGKTPAMERNTP